jgi:hypothetical protein
MLQKAGSGSFFFDQQFEFVVRRARTNLPLSWEYRMPVNGSFYDRLGSEHSRWATPIFACDHPRNTIGDESMHIGAAISALCAGMSNRLQFRSSTMEYM